MATNTGKGYRQGSIKERVQIFNPSNKKWAKVDVASEKIIDQKANGEPFKGVAKFRDDRRD